MKPGDFRNWLRVMWQEHQEEFESVEFLKEQMKKDKQNSIDYIRKYHDS